MISNSWIVSLKFISFQSNCANFACGNDSNFKPFDQSSTNTDYVVYWYHTCTTTHYLETFLAGKTFYFVDKFVHKQWCTWQPQKREIFVEMTLFDNICQPRNQLLRLYCEKRKMILCLDDDIRSYFECKLTVESMQTLVTQVIALKANDLTLQVSL